MAEQVPTSLHNGLALAPEAPNAQRPFETPCRVGAIGVASFSRMATFGLAEAAEALRERVGRGARYPFFTPPNVARDDRSQRRRWERLLWAASLILLAVVLVLAVLVAVGL
jgi:hypothetical protein